MAETGPKNKSRVRAFLGNSGRAGKRNEPLTAAAWTTFSMLMLACLSIVAKFAYQEGIEPLQIVFLRNIFCLLLLSPLLFIRGPSIMQSARPGLYGVRVTLSLISMVLWFSALSMIPIGELQAIGFLAPLFTALFAIFLLNERVTGLRWIALLVGFAGALVILRPWSFTLGLGQMLALGAALSIGLVGPLVKQLTATDDSDKIVFITHLWVTPMSLIPALLVWTWPPLWLWPVLFGLGVCAVLGHLALVRGFASADASLVVSLEFSRLPFAVTLAYLVFGETIDVWVWVGAIIIFGAAVYLTRGEASRRRKAADNPEPAAVSTQEPPRS